MRGISTFVALLAVCFPAYGCSPLISSLAPFWFSETPIAATGYQKYTFKEYGFSVAVPTTLSASPVYKSSSLLMHEYNGEIPGKAGFGVCFYHLPSEVRNTAAKDQVIDYFFDGFFTGKDFKLLSENKVRVEGAYAKDEFYAIPDPDVPATGHVRYILFTKTACVLSVIIPDSEYSPNAFQKFFDSFKILVPTRE